MTKEEAIENLKLIRLNAVMTGAESFKEALDLAIVSLSKPSLPSELNEAAKKIAYDVCKQLPNGTEKDSIVYYAILAAKAGAEWTARQEVSLAHLIAWYIQSVDANEPVWTKEHLEELVKDYILIPKN